MTAKKIALVFFSLAQILLLNIPGVGDTAPNEIFEAKDVIDPRIIPADGTFAIWGFIFPACIVYAFYMAFFQKDKNALGHKVSDWALLAFFTISIYDVVARYKDISWLTAVVFFPALYFLIRAILVFTKEKAISKTDYRFTYPALSVYAAWASLATIVNTSSSLIKLGYHGEPIGEVAWSVIGLILATAVTSWVIKTTKNPWYFGAIIWANIGIFINGYEKGYTDVMVMAVLAIMVNALVFWKGKMVKTT